VKLYRNDETGIAWVEDGTSGTGHSAHPNISATGSITGIRNLGYWKKDERCVRSHGFIYNIDRLSVSDELDEIAAQECRCQACIERRNVGA
jgi:hypothetical protein